MIKSLNISNFQSHKDTKLEFSPGVNVIIGQSDNGKSVVLRALNWVINNKPCGDAFRSDWGGETKVELITECGLVLHDKISRIKDKTTNSYILHGGNKKLEFKAFGQGVPQEIEQALNFSPLNFQYQMDSPFLLSKNSGEVARYFNQVTNLQIIDSSLTNITKKVRDEQSNLSAEKIKIEELNSSLLRYEDLPDAEHALKQLEILEPQINTARNKSDDLSFLIHKIQKSEESIQDTERILKAEKDINQMITIQKDKIMLMTKRATIQKLIRSIENTADEIQQLVAVAKAEPEIVRATSILNKIKQKQEEVNSLRQLINQIETRTESIILDERRLRQAQQKFDELMPEQCPLCGKGK